VSRRRPQAGSRLPLVRPVAIAIGIAVLAVLAGCGAASEGDPELTIYLSAPLSGPRSLDGRDVADGATLALEDAGGEAAGTRVTLEVLDDADDGGWDAALSGANARAATEDSTTIAYLGELDSGASRTSIPITNQAGILQVSPGAAAEDLTREAIGSDAVPTAIQPSGARTFGRVIPSDRAQGEAAGSWMSDEGIASVMILGEKESFGAAIASGLAAAPSAPAIVATAQSPEALLFAGELPVGDSDGLLLPKGAALFGTDALLADPALLKGFEGIAAGKLGGSCRPADGCEPPRLTSAAVDPAQLPPEAAAFLDDFEAAYDRPPGRLAAYGYEAMAATLDSIERAEDPLDRKAVVDAFFATADRPSILGTYSIDEVGNTTLSRLGAYEVRGGRAVPEPEPIAAG